MKNLLKSTLVGAMTAATLAATASAGHAATTISQGHIDAFDVDYVNGQLTLDVKTHTPVNDDVAPSTLVLGVKPEAATTVPSTSAYSCLGAAGSTTYVLPQSENTNLLWPGWNTADIPLGALQNNNVSLSLVSATVPTGGKFALYTVSSLGTPTFRFNTNTSGTCAKSTWSGIARNVHGHGNWAFSTPGTYNLTFKATATTSAGQAVTSQNVTYTFQVG